MRPTSRLALGAFTLLTVLADTPLLAQNHPGGSPLPVFQVPSNLNLLRGADSRRAPTSLLADSSKGTPDYRYEGAVAGALIIGGGMAYLYHGLCESDCQDMKVGLLAGVVGGLFGLLIGGMIPKDTPPP